MPEPKHGEVLVRVIYLSLDPYQRGRMRDAASYAAAVGLNEVMTGGTVGEVVASHNASFKVGDIVEDRLGWQEYAIGGGPSLRKVDPSIAPISTANGVLGMPGMTAYFGLLDVGQPKPGETIVVSAASGAVGQVVGQIGKIMGCRVVGIAGGAKKCAFVKDELGFDACLDYKAEKDLDAALRAACPNGIDVYFDNVGGEISDAVLRNINFFGRVALCGSISQYNATTPPMGPRLLGTFVGKRARPGVHRHRLRRALRASAPPDGRVGALGPHPVSRGHRRRHRQGAARFHRHAARRELRQDAGQSGMSYDAPFAGLKVVDLSQGIAGPYCAMLLAQYGAEVIKVEGIGEGDWARTLGARYGSHSAYLDHRQSRQESIAVDLKSEAGKQVVWRLLQGADVFLEGFRPGVIQRLGFDLHVGRARASRDCSISRSRASARPARCPAGRRWTRCCRPIPA